MELENGLPFKFYFENLDSLSRVLPNNLTKEELDEYNLLCDSEYSWDIFVRDGKSQKFIGPFVKSYISKNKLETTNLDDDNLIYVCESFTPTPYYNNQFIDNMQADVLQKLKEGKIKVIFNWFGEPMYDENLNYYINKICKENDIDASNFIILTSANNIKNNSNIKYISDHFFLENCANSLKTYLNNKSFKATGFDFISQIIDHSVFETKKTKHFISLNRHYDRPHRYGLGLFLEKHNLWDKGNFSFLVCEQEYTSSAVLIETLSNSNAEDYLQYANSFLKKLPMELDTQFLDKDNKIHNFRTSEVYYPKIYEESAINIVTETTFKNNSVFLSEKTFHPIINLQPFVVFSSNGHLKVLQELGFKTFAPFINEEYDDELNSQKRFKMVCDEILRLSELSMDEINNLLLELKSICIYNRNHLLSFTKYDVFENSLQKIKNYGI